MGVGEVVGGGVPANGKTLKIIGFSPQNTRFRTPDSQLPAACSYFPFLPYLCRLKNKPIGYKVF